MFRKAAAFAGRFAELFSKNRLVMASAALAYHLTMTFFPLVIVLYTLLGNNYTKAMRILGFARNLMAVETVEYLRGFLNYVALHNSTAMMIAGITVLVSSASAAVRLLHFTVGGMQGGVRFRGLALFVFSVLFSVLLIAGVYLGMIVMLSGREVIQRINALLPFVDLGDSWNTLRFLILAGIELGLFWITYAVLRRKGERYPVLPGALLATVAMLAVSLAFSLVIGASVKYPLVYGSLASLILLMLWLYFSGAVFFCGAALNICIRDSKEAEGPR